MWWMACWGWAAAAEVVLGTPDGADAALVVDQWTLAVPGSEVGDRSGALRWRGGSGAWAMAELVEVRASPGGDPLAVAFAAALRGGDAGPAALAAALELIPEPAAPPAQAGFVKVTVPGQAPPAPVGEPPADAIVVLGALITALAEAPERMWTERLAPLAGQTLPSGEDLRRDAGLVNPSTGEVEVGEVVLRVEPTGPCPGRGPDVACVQLALSRGRWIDVGADVPSKHLEVVERWWVEPGSLRVAVASREVKASWTDAAGVAQEARGSRTWTLWRAPPAPP